ncbi:MAG TPA: permease prefix domain 1-containing protein [Euzebyales bacterium]|nr:permease prefix domain 1-containing protein [Euzebyales bacterium]
MAYLRAVERRLPGPARPRRAVLDEMHDGLIEAVAARQRRGLSAEEAVRGAVDEFGAPDVVAAAHRAELTLHRSRRAAWRVLLLVFAGGLAWRAYDAFVGVPPTVIPDAASARSAFLLLTSTIKVVPAAVHAAAILLLVSTRCATCDSAGRRRLLRLGWVVTAALVLSLCNMVGIVLVGSDVVGSSLLISLALTGAVVAALVENLRANHAVWSSEPAVTADGVIPAGGPA